MTGHGPACLQTSAAAVLFIFGGGQMQGHFV